MLHVGNVERTLSVFPSLINSKGIYMEYKDAVRQRDEKRDEREEQEEEGDGEIKDWPKFLKSEKLVTAYLSGPYKHYRGHSAEYPVVDINFLHLPAVAKG